MVVAGLASSAPSSSAQPAAQPSVDIVKVNGFVDPPLVDYVRSTVAAAEDVGATVVLQIDSRGGYGDRAAELARSIRDVEVPVVAWVGPSGARAEGASLQLVYAADVVAVAPGAGIGPARPFDLALRAGAEDAAGVERGSAQLLALAGTDRAAGVRRMLEGRALAAGPARDLGAADMIAPDRPGEEGISGLLRQLDGTQIPDGGGVFRTLNREDRPVAVRFHDMGAWRRTLHAATTPVAFYVLVVLGLWGIAFELTQPGIGLAGIAGVLALAFAVYSGSVVPIGWIGFALLLGGVALQAADVLIRRVGILTFGGTAAFVAGSWLAWKDVAPAVDLPLWLVALFTLGGFLFFGFGMTVALKARERVRTAQVGLVGLVGEVRSDLDPEGGVFVKGAMWRARSGNGRIPRGTKVRVRGIDGLVLRVTPEPEAGPDGAPGT